jgi:hypothetical protein
LQFVVYIQPYAGWQSVPIHRTGTRKTIKILSGRRFQWAAIDPGQKQFSGTGGGTYDLGMESIQSTLNFSQRQQPRWRIPQFDGKLGKRCMAPPRTKFKSDAIMKYGAGI